MPEQNAYGLWGLVIINSAIFTRNQSPMNDKKLDTSIVKSDIPE